MCCRRCEVGVAAQKPAPAKTKFVLDTYGLAVTSRRGQSIGQAGTRAIRSIALPLLVTLCEDVVGALDAALVNRISKTVMSNLLAALLPKVGQQAATPSVPGSRAQVETLQRAWRDSYLAEHIDLSRLMASSPKFSALVGLVDQMRQRQGADDVHHMVVFRTSPRQSCS